MGSRFAPAPIILISPAFRAATLLDINTPAGAVVLGTAGTTGSLGTGAVTNNGTLTINRSDAPVIANTITGTGAGILVLTGTQHAQVIGNTVASNAGIGLQVLNASSNRLEDNQISGSGDAAMVLEGASGNTVIGNSVFSSGDVSLLVHLGSNGNRIEANDLSEGEAGIFVSQSNGNELVENVAHDNGDSGIVLEVAHDNLVKGNDVRFNSGGIEMDASTGNRIEANNASETNGTGIEVGDGSVRNVFVQNTASANEAGGISVETFAAPGAGNLLDRNVANDNTGDGIYVGNVGHMIVGNTANNNSEWGIYAADRETGEAVYDLNSAQRYVPGSPTKLFPAAAALWCCWALAARSARVVSRSQEPARQPIGPGRTIDTSQPASRRRLASASPGPLASAITSHGRPSGGAVPFPPRGAAGAPIPRSAARRALATASSPRCAPIAMSSRCVRMRFSRQVIPPSNRCR